MSPQMNYIPEHKPLETKKVGIYYRVSSNKATQLESLAAQISGLTKEVAKISKWVLEDTFIDIASAKAGSSRREFNRMIIPQSLFGQKKRNKAVLWSRLIITLYQENFQKAAFFKIGVDKKQREWYNK